MRQFVCLILAALVIVSAAPLFAQTVTEDNLLNLVGKKMQEDMIVSLVGMAKKVEVDTSVENLAVLMSKGISPVVLKAVVDRKEQLNPTPQAPALVSAPASTTTALAAGPANIPDDHGVYVETSKGLEALPVEMATPKASVFGAMISASTGGIKKTKMEGEIKSPRSSAQFAKPVALVLHGEFTLVPLQSGKKSRKFVTATYGGFRSINMQGDSIPIAPEKIGPGVYRIVLSDIPDGEYGLLDSQLGAPGGGYRLYTFGAHDGQSMAMRE